MENDIKNYPPDIYSIRPLGWPEGQWQVVRISIVYEGPIDKCEQFREKAYQEQKAKYKST